MAVADGRYSINHAQRIQRRYHRKYHRVDHRITCPARGRLSLGKIQGATQICRNLEEYDFYPFTINRENFPEFNLKDFRLGMHYFLKNNDYTAARQLIFIG